MTLFICSYCGSERKNSNSWKNHERSCPANPDRPYVNGMTGKKGSNQFIKAHEKGLSLRSHNYIPDAEVFVENSSIVRHAVKRRIIKDNLIEHKCAECGLGSTWNGKDLVLQLDHINGVSNDNRITNLRFLCPNCHTQQNTYAAKNKKNPDRKTKPYYTPV